jgi:threonine aldolase
MPTGTLANHLAVRELAAGAGGRAILQAESHLFNDSGDCVQTLSAMTLMPLGAGRATFTLEEVEEVVGRTQSGRVARPVSVLSIETPVRRRFGETFDQVELDRITAFARGEGIRLHLDGARLFLQSGYTGIDVAEYARPFDTVYVSLYKYFNAVSGAILAGPRDLLDGMYHTRRMFGAGLPGAWPFAAVALHYLPGFVDRFRDAVDVSEAFIEQVTRHDAFTVERITAGTNLFRLRVAGTDPGAFRRRLQDRGVDLGGMRPDGSVLVGVNETWNRATADDLADRFRTALG